MCVQKIGWVQDSVISELDWVRSSGQSTGFGILRAQCGMKLNLAKKRAQQD